MFLEFGNVVRNTNREILFLMLILSRNFCKAIPNVCKAHMPAISIISMFDLFLTAPVAISGIFAVRLLSDYFSILLQIKGYTLGD